MKVLYENMNIPIACKVGNTLFKKLFYGNISMKHKDKEIFKEHIKKIVWVYSLKADTINILPYKDEIREYQEIALIQVELYRDNKIKRIAALIQRTIPYPIILVFEYNDSILINVAHRLTNKVDKAKDIVEELIFTDGMI